MILVLLVVAAALAALGWPGVQRHRRALGPGATLVAAACLALAVLVPVAMAALLAGLSWTLALVVAALAAAGVSAVLREPGGAAAVTAARAEPRLLRAASLALLLAAVAAFVVKVVRAPLWSWDHYAIWGVKARRLIGETGFDLAFLSWPELEASRPDHPLGLPLSWLVLTLGRPPDAIDFQALHLLMGLALLLLVRGAVRRATGSWAWGDLAAAMLALSPLYWDTAGVGLAELPLALWAACGAGILLAAPGSRRTAAAGGVLLGFLPWVKTEGAMLGLLVVAGLLWALQGPAADRRRLAAAVVAGFATLSLGAWAVGRLVLPAGVSFTVGDWSGRAFARLPESGEIARFCLRDLLAWDWLLFWPILAIGWLVAIF
ncbi:MAG TPA: hypothetical protein VM617_03290, partial [Thermoanaerobaculia bacterium]|nr:hypothetical protein [Thermoanaerobaculia bacterium]